MRLNTITLCLLLGSLPLLAWSQDEEVVPLATASATLAERYYLSPQLSYTHTDNGRQTKDGPGAAVAIGKQLNPYFTVELSGQYGQFDPATLIGGTLNTLFFPTRASFYALVGAGYAQVRKQPGPDRNYATGLFQLGAGWLFKPLNVFGADVLLRTEAVYRLDAHNGRRGDNSGNGRKAFNDALLGIGLVIPLGRVAPPAVETPPAEPAPVEVVPVEQPAPAAPEPAPEAAPPPPSCTPPAAGQTMTLEGCGEGDTLVLSGVYFATDKALLSPNASTILDTVADALLARQEVQVEIGGHTDSDASSAHNQQLSERRAKAVMDYLVTRGIATARLSSKGYGEDVPVADNASEDGRALNRRVELKIVAVGAAAVP